MKVQNAFTLAAVVLGVALATLLTACGGVKNEAYQPEKITPARTEAGTGYVYGNGLIRACLDGLVFVYYNHRGGVVQVMGTTGKPLTCEN